MTEQKFKRGDRVRKVTGDYHLNGVVIGRGVTSRGKVRYMVEHKPGFLHIYSASNLKLLTPK